MGIVTKYTRTYGDPDSRVKGPKGTLSSTIQKRPYVTGPYHSIRAFNTPAIIGPNQSITVNSQVINGLRGEGDQLGLDYLDQKSLEIARSRLNNRLIKGRAALGITAATANQSFAMIAKRATMIRNAYKALRTGNVRKLERELGLKRSANGSFKELRFSERKLPPHIVRHFNLQAHKAAKRKKHLAKWEKPQDVWLEYTFGWVPLVADIGQVAQVKSDPFAIEACFGTCTMSGKIKRKVSSSMTVEMTRKTKTICSAGIRITNPNLALSTQLGLTNPLLVAWDIIPFSFVVDWFFKISTFLGRYNDMAGFSYIDPTTFVIKEAIGKGTDTRYKGHVAYAAGRSRERKIGIINKPVYPQFKLPDPSLWLAATSVALTLQQLKR